MSYTTYSTLVAEPFENEIGQTIYPGDKVVAVTTGYGHSVSIFTGIFEGVRRSKSSNKIVGSRVGSVPDDYREREFRDDGEYEETTSRWNAAERKWDYTPTGRRWSWKTTKRFRKSNLQLNRVFRVDTPLAEVKIR